MAKSKVAQSSPAIQDRSFWFSDLSFVPASEKESKLWFAQSLFFAKLNSVQLETVQKVSDYRQLGRLVINEKTYREMVDPPTPMGGGGTAEFFAADFKANPISIHLDNILLARLDKIAQTETLEVNEIDKFAKSQRQRDKDKMIYRREFRKLINEINKDLKLPPLKESEDPFQYAEHLNGQDVKQKVDNISKVIEQIKARVIDDKDWALYDTNVYKGSVEHSLEMAIKYYMEEQNKWRIISQLFIQDIKYFNRFCGLAVTDRTTGRKTVKYVSPEQMFTSPFVKLDGEDILYYYYEQDITFADFVREFGTTLTDEELKEVFDLNKIQGAQHGQAWSATNSRVRNSALIRIGYYAVLSQEAGAFSDEYVKNPIPQGTPEPLTWDADKESGTEKRKIYNVWHSCYYIPPPGQYLNSNNIQASWQWQSKYIFNIEKDVDMYRYGVDMRYAKSPLVIWKDSRPSFMDIQQAYMPKINNAWHKFQNCIIQDTTALGMDYDLISGLLNAVDEGNKINPGEKNKGTGGNGIDTALNIWRSLKQGGTALLKFRDKNGNILVPDPSKLFVQIDTKHLEKAEKLLEIMLNLYQQMVMSLAQNDITQGGTPKPRTPVEGIQAALDAANNGIWFVEKPVREMMIMFAERFVQHILCIIRDKTRYSYADRWEELGDVLGQAQLLTLEGLQDMTPDQIGISVTLENTETVKEWLFTLASQLATNREVSWESAGLVVNTLRYGSYKYAYALLMLAKNEQERKLQQQQQEQFQQQMALAQQNTQAAMALQNAAAQGKNSNLQTQGMIDAQLQQQMGQIKDQSQSNLVEQRHLNKLQDNQQKSQLKREENTPQPIQI